MKYRILYLYFFIFIAQCIKSQNTNELLKSADYYASLTKLTLDTDGDGVSDYLDRCIETPTGARIDGSGCALDMDMDGIIDLYDQCICTPGIDSLQGCPEIEYIDYGGDDYNGVNFLYKNDNFVVASYPLLNHAANLILKYGKGMTFLVEGHANEYKSERKNKKLSLDRAKIVKEYLVQKGVDPNQLKVKGVGSSDLLYPECEVIEFCYKKGDDWKNEANRRLVMKVLSSDSSNE